MSAPQIAAWLAGVGIRAGGKYARSAGSRLSRQLFKNKKHMLAAAAGAGGANLAYSSKRLPDGGGMKNYYRVVKPAPPAPTARRPRKALNPKRIVQTDPTSASKRPRALSSTYGGRFKKRRRSKRVTRPTQGNKDSVYGTITAQEAVYSGFSTCGGREHAIKQFSEQLVKQVCYERKIDIKGRTDPLSWNNAHVNHIKSLRLHYRLVHGDGSVGDAFMDAALTTTSTGNISESFDGAVTNVASVVSQVLTIDGRYFFGYELLNNDVGTAQPQPPDVVRLQMDTWRFKLNVYISYKIQNITPADDATGTVDDTTTYSRDSIMSNPLRGRSYEFSPGYPRLRPGVVDSVDGLNLVTNEYRPYGFVQFPAPASTVYNPKGVLHDPPPGGTLFQNCQKGASMHIQPGNFKTLTSRFTFSGSVKQLCKKLQSSGTSTGGNFCRFTLGNTICYGLVPVMRTKDDENVRLAYQYDISSTASLRPKYRCSVPRSNTSHLLPIGFTSYTFVPEPPLPTEVTPPASQEASPTTPLPIIYFSGGPYKESYDLVYESTSGDFYIYNLSGFDSTNQIYSIKYDTVNKLWVDHGTSHPDTITNVSGVVTAIGQGELKYTFFDPYYTSTTA